MNHTARFVLLPLLLCLLALSACRRDELVPPEPVPAITLLSPPPTDVLLTPTADLRVSVQSDVAVLSVVFELNGVSDTASFDSTMGNGGSTSWARQNFPFGSGINTVFVTVNTADGRASTERLTVVRLSLTPGSLASQLTVPRCNHTATLLNDGRVLITGGVSTAGGAALSTAEIYSPLTNIFAALPNAMRAARAGHTATRLADGTVLLVGGRTADADDAPYAEPQAETFNPATNTFSAATFAQRIARSEHAAAITPAGNFVFNGGIDSTGETLSDERYYPLTTQPYESSRLLFPFLRNPARHTLTRTGNTLAVIGYLFIDGQPISLNEVVIGIESFFTNEMAQPRFNHAACEATPGLILLSGGSRLDANGAERALSSIELLTTEPLRFYRFPNAMLSERTEHTATLLPDGRIFIAGGKNSTAVLSSAEMFFN